MASSVAKGCLVPTRLLFLAIFSDTNPRGDDFIDMMLRQSVYLHLALGWCEAVAVAIELLAQGCKACQAQHVSAAGEGECSQLLC